VIDAAPLDVFEGIAGEILALLAVRELLPDDELLDPAVACGRRLLAEARPAAGGGTAWPTVNGRLLTGFSHGAAGIALALARLSAATGERSFHDAAVEAVRYEDSIRDDEVGNWPDLREDDQPAYKANWCHGAPGIGLARLSGRECLEGPEIVHDIDVAVATTRAVALTGPDHLCCGSLGRVEFLLSAGRTRGDADVEAEGRRRLEVIAGRAVAHGGFDLSAVLPGRVYVPGFFMGLSGIGYLLARSFRPDLVPSVLAWDRVPDPLGRPDQPAQDHAGGHHEGTTDRLVAR
jgi:lantibiotic modifying enzyme